MMIAAFRKSRTSRLQAIRAYLLIVLFWTLLLFASSVVTLQQQRSLPLEKLGFSEAQAHREIWFTAFSIFMFLSVLAIGLFLFVRVTWDLRWFELRSQFISGVSHEFKTPLSLIRLYSETLSADDADFSQEDRQKYVRIIARESERLSRLINNVLEFSRMEQSPIHRDLPEGDLEPTVTQAIQDYSEYLTWKGFDLRVSIQPNLPRVRFNQEQVSQMILNLLDNARKYSGTSRLIQLRARTLAGDAAIEVQDNGIGIPADEKDKIFQPFYRISNASNQGGCGLGLYLVEQTMKQHGGRIEVESEANRGSLFRMIFPASVNRLIDRRSIVRRLFSGSSPTKQVREIS
jgi:two-component system, OmpR family, phosphate regulon sensor histidine kinase PhoR